jgi:methylmalonyl-CoA mutase C-terminal domain/subunit
MTDLFADGPRARGRVLVGTVGSDLDEAQLGRLARQLRDAGFETIYVPADHSPEMLVAAAIDEDVDALVLAAVDGSDRKPPEGFDEAIRATGRDLRVLVLAPGDVLEWPDGDNEPLEPQTVGERRRQV